MQEFAFDDSKGNRQLLLIDVCQITEIVLTKEFLQQDILIDTSKLAFDINSLSTGELFSITGQYAQVPIVKMREIWVIKINGNQVFIDDDYQHIFNCYSTLKAQVYNKPSTNIIDLLSDK